jgi:hypothetical protein
MAHSRLIEHSGSWSRIEVCYCQLVTGCLGCRLGGSKVAQPQFVRCHGIEYYTACSKQTLRFFVVSEIIVILNVINLYAWTFSFLLTEQPS